MARVSTIIPAYNEADIIEQTIRAVQGISEIDQIVVVDDGSADDTAKIAASCGAIVISDGRRRGKGGAMNKALSEAKGDILLLLDADLGKSAAEAGKLLAPVLADECDMTIAIFQSKEIITDKKLAAKSGGFGLAVKTARAGIKILTGKVINSPLAGQRALKREIVERIGGFAPRFGVETGLTIDALKMGYRVSEVPVNMVHRASGRDIRGFIHRGRQLRDILFTLARKALK